MIKIYFLTTAMIAIRATIGENLYVSLCYSAIRREINLDYFLNSIAHIMCLRQHGHFQVVIFIFQITPQQEIDEFQHPIELYLLDISSARNSNVERFVIN